MLKLLLSIISLIHVPFSQAALTDSRESELTNRVSTSTRLLDFSGQSDELIELLEDTDCIQVVEELNENLFKIDISMCSVSELPPGSIMLMAGNNKEGDGAEF